MEIKMIRLVKKKNNCLRYFQNNNNNNNNFFQKFWETNSPLGHQVAPLPIWLIRSILSFSQKQ